MTLEDDQMIPKGDHCGRIRHHMLVSLSPTRHTEYFVHINLLLFVSIELLTRPISRHNRYSYNYQSNIYHIE